MLQKHLFAFLLCLHFCLPSLYSQPSFNRNIGLYSFGYAYLSPSLPNGDILIVGDSNGVFNKALMVSRIDTAGQTQASWRFSTTPALSFMRSNGLARLADGRVAMVGQGRLDPNNLGIVCILDTDGQGGAARYLDLGAHTSCTAVEATPDSGLVIGGFGFTANLTYACFIARYDKQLNLIWNYQLITPTFTPQLSGLTVLPDGSVVLAGDLFSGGDPVLFVARVDALGSVKWAHAYSSSSLSMGHRSLQYGGGDKLYLSATTNDYATTKNQMALMAIDTAGNFLWGNAVWNPIGFSAGNHSMLAGYDGTWILHGLRDGLGAHQVGMAAAFSSSGSLLWARTLAFDGPYDNIEDVVLHPNGGYLWMVNQSYTKRIIKTDSLGLMSLPCGPFPLNAPTTSFQLGANPLAITVSAGPSNTPFTITNHSTVISNASDCIILGTAPQEVPIGIQVLPQPLHHSARILLSGVKLTQNAQLHITDLSGSRLSLPTTRLSDGWEIQRGGLPAGIYAYQVLQDGQRIASGKLWVAD